jgi:WD40 repeat protein
MGRKHREGDRHKASAALARHYEHSFSPNGTRIATTYHGGSVSIWDVKKGKEIAELSGSQEWSTVFSPDGTRILTPLDDEAAWLWDEETGGADRHSARAYA